VTADQQPYIPVQVYLDQNNVPASVTNRVEVANERVTVNDDETWEVVPEASVHLIQGAAFVQIKVSDRDLLASLPAAVRRHANIGFDHVLGKKQLEAAAKSMPDDFIKKRMLPFVV